MVPGMRTNLTLLLLAGSLVACTPSASPDDAPPATATPPAGDTTDVPSECPAPTAGPTVHKQGVKTSETWTADASPHMIPWDMNIEPGATLTLEPCAEVLIAKGATVSVVGKLVAQGEAARRVHIGAQDPTKPFSKIRTTRGSIDLAYTTIDGGGDRLNTLSYLTGTLDLQGEDESKPTQATIK